MTRSRSPAVYASIGSLAAHAVVAAWLLTRAAPEPKPERVQPVEFTFYEPAPAAAVVAAPSTVPASAAERGQTAPTLRAKLAIAAPVTPAPVAPAVEPNVSAPSPSSASPAVPVKASAPARAIDISPLAAALTMRDALGAGSCEALRSDDAGCAAEGAKAPSVPAIASGPRLGVRGAAELDLEREADGSLSYDSPAFSARIAPDGRVRFEDKIRDLNTLVEGVLVGGQINTSEKRRFMESTASLREELAARSEARNQVSAMTALRAKLASVLASGTLNLVQKRRALFALWDSCASDDSGNAAQAAIEDFIRTRLPADSPLAYSSAELALLNKRRVSRRVFDPYASADAGALPS